ncbi:hypothetical protein [Bernardetia sp. MNP-M8]|uniref:hypothetical protein n=1 Tax=Bernardetia sp. MNP-M8 TaxID=3127470 RepID=UPI0030CD75CC
MKKVIYYFLLFLVISSCTSHKSYQKNDMICEVGMQFKEYEKMFDKKLNPKRGEWQEVDSGSFSISYAILLNPVRSILSVTKVYKSNPTIHQEMQYDTLRRIKSVCYTYDNVYLGNTYFFDTLGNITKTIDERQADKYPICFREALEIVKRKIPNHYSISGLDRDSTIVDEKKVYYWEVNTKTPRKPYNAVVYRLSGKTGRVIKKYKTVSVRD